MYPWLNAEHQTATHFGEQVPRRDDQPDRPEPLPFGVQELAGHSEDGLCGENQEVRRLRLVREWTAAGGGG